MKTPGRIGALALLTALCFALGAGALSSRFPPVHPDEVVFSVHGFNLLSGAGHRYSLYDDLFAPSVYPMRDALPDITRTFYNTWVGLWLKAAGRSYRHARWSSVAAGVGVLGLMYLIGKRLKGPSFGLTLVLLTALNPIVLYASCLVRPEIALLFGTALAFWMILTLPSLWAWTPYLIGLVGGLQTGIHWNAFAMGVGLGVTDLCMTEPARRARQGLIFSAGFLSGALLAFATVNPEKFLLSLRTVNYLISTPPPVLAGPGGLWSAILNTLGTWFRGQSSYSTTALVGGWRLAMAATWAGLGLALIGGGLGLGRMRRGSAERVWMKAAGLGGASALAAMLLLVKRQELDYVIVLFPFLFPIAGWVWRAPGMRALRWVSVASLVSGAALFLFHARRYAGHTRPFDQILEEMHRLAPDPSLKWAGPNLLWFGLPPENFRDFGAILTSGWYTGGQKDVRGSLERWRPEIVVIDSPYAHALWGQTPALEGLRNSLKVPVERLGIVHTGDGAYHDWEVFRVDWPVRR